VSTSFSLILFKALVLLTFSFMIVEVLYFRVRNNLKAHVGDVDAAAVPCGFGRAIGNKVSLS
jgi:hypothetical protein